jgi:hypothetical protein
MHVMVMIHDADALMRHKSAHRPSSDVVGKNDLVHVTSLQRVVAHGASGASPCLR